MEWHYIAPGKPMQNGYVESFNAACATNCSTRLCSWDSATPEAPSRVGYRFTIPHDLTPRWATRHRQTSQDDRRHALHGATETAEALNASE